MDQRTGRQPTAARRSNSHSIRTLEGEVKRQLGSRFSLWLHGWLMDQLTLMSTWSIPTLLMHRGVRSPALRYAVALGIGDLIYLSLLRPWAGALLTRRKKQNDLDPDIDLINHGHPDTSPSSGSWGSGGDFSGESAGGSYDLAAASRAIEGSADGLAHVVSETAANALMAWMWATRAHWLSSRWLPYFQPC